MWALILTPACLQFCKSTDTSVSTIERVLLIRIKGRFYTNHKVCLDAFGGLPHLTASAWFIAMVTRGQF